MNKVLDDLDFLRYIARLDWSDETPTGQELNEAYQRLLSILTPPTYDEVCEALSEYLQREVKMYSDNTFYYTEQRQIGECDEIICGYGWENEHHTIAFEFDLPPHLITLIGRFYEGVEKK